MLPAARVLLSVVLIATLHSSAAAQDDVVQVKNGDRITGGVAELERGELAFSTDSARTIDIVWNDVVRLTSTQMLDVELSSGTRYTGTVSSPQDGELVVQTASGPTMPIPLSEIAHIRVVAATFVERTSGAVDFIFNWTRSSTTYALDGRAANRTRSYDTKLTFDSWLSARDEGETTTRNNIELDVRRRLSFPWYAVGIVHVQEDDELELDWRAFLGGGVGVWLVDTSTLELAVEAGVDYNGERYASADGADRSAEVFGGVDWEWSPNGSTTASVDARSEVSLQRSRIRFEFSAELRRDIFWDLYWSVHAFDDFDSDPPDDRPQSAFGLAFGLGWSF
jgi:hypothetical protein